MNKSLVPILECLSGLAFGRSREACFLNKTCVRCGKEIAGFRDEISEREYGISGMCQECQDDFFCEGEEGPMNEIGRAS